MSKIKIQSPEPILGDSQFPGILHFSFERR